MEFLRRLFGKSSQGTARDAVSRRASHVTPSRTQRVNMPIREPEPTAREPEPEIEALAAAETAAEAVAEALEAHRDDPAPEPEARPPAAEITATNRQSAANENVAAVLEAEPTGIPAAAPVLTRQRQALTYGIASDIGIVRDNNEDACFGMQWHSITVDDRPDFGLFIVADGMGGHLDGERASGVAVQMLASEMIGKIYAPMLKDFNAGSGPTILEALVNASEVANRAVIKRVPGGGTTLSAVAIVGNLAYLVHVGDSRAYLLYEDKIEQLTTDHTLVQRLIEMNELTLEEAEHYPQKNVLYRAIGQNEKLKMERLIRALPAGSSVLICTDGLWDLVEDVTIRNVAASSSTPQEACDSLVRLANARGGTDNITVILFKVPGDEAIY
ncbi:MAG: protein phosphatase 2C domain-containing protein [Chloroflexota bacterium]|nr:protein phosphatase 2C domain-containing protein [Chloroflexota bacterium]MDE2946320.1 protein phosphatase 2C domain-containing protein [Chloroflexota bacterium]